MVMNTNWSPGSRASLNNVVTAKAAIAFPLKIADKNKWTRLRKHLVLDTPIGWKARRACPYLNGQGSLVFSCNDPQLFINMTPEWIERMTAKVQLITEV